MPIVIGHDPNPGALLQLEQQMGLQEQFNNQQARDLRAVQESANITQGQQAAQEHQREFNITSQANQQAEADNTQYQQSKIAVESAQAQQRYGGANSPTTRAALSALEDAHNNGSLPDDAYAAAKVNLLAGKRVTSAGDATADQRADTADTRAQQAMQNASASAMNKDIAQAHMSASDEVKAAQAAVKGAIPYTKEWYDANNAVQAAYSKLAGVGDTIKAKYAPQSAAGAPQAGPTAAQAATGAAGPPAGAAPTGAPALKPIPRSMISQFIANNGNDPNAAKKAAQAAGFDPNNIIPG